MLLIIFVIYKIEDSFIMLGAILTMIVIKEMVKLINIKNVVIGIGVKLSH